MLPAAGYGQALLASDIVFGAWDADTETFTRDDAAREAVQVLSNQLSERGNPIRNILLGILGFDTFDAVRTAVFVAELDGCYTDGFIARGVVDFQSNNDFVSDFCIHSNDHVSLNNNNSFGPEVIVSMPDLDDLDVPNSGMASNPGLEEALRIDGKSIDVVDMVPAIINDLSGAYGEYLPDYVHNYVPKNLNGKKKVSPTDLYANSVNVVSCQGNSGLTLEDGVYQNMVIVSECDIKFSQGVALEDVVVATTDTSDRSMNAPSGLQIGKNDNCMPGGGAVLLTKGGFSAASGLNIFGSQVIAMKDIDFSANADGIDGASLVAGGRIDTTSNGQMGRCPDDGSGAMYTVKSVRMVY